jgi:tRNA nucleotidyltransferase (CCA-adding enzyme)
MPYVRFQDVLSDADVALLRALGHAAHDAGGKLWAVGGVVRDALVRNPVVDIDLTSETPAAELGPVLAASVAGTVAKLTPFGTLKLSIPQGTTERTLDLATTRTETYAAPAALPDVKPTDLRSDLARRDFTINAMAASLAPTDFGTVSDLHGGITDLSAKRIRALHERSFQDDPTRQLRAVRYATRLGYRIDRRTSAWMRRDVGYLDALSPARARHEIERILSEPTGAKSLTQSWDRSILAALHPALGAPAVRASLATAARAHLTGMELLGALIYPLPTADAEAVVARFGLTKPQQAVVRGVVAGREHEPTLAGAAPSEIAHALGNAPAAAITAIAHVSRDAHVRSALRRYARATANVRVAIAIGRAALDGREIAALGVPAGPPVGQALAALRSAELDGKVRTHAGAVRFIRRRVQET